NTGVVSNDGGSSVGSSWGDIDNDGDLDLFVCNDDLQNNFLYLNNGAPDYDFTKITTGSVVNDAGNSFGCTFGDYNNDGALDLFVANRLNQKNFLYVNNGNSNSWIGIKCKGVISAKSAIGTKVRIKAQINGQPVWQLREIQTQSGYNSGNLILNFGLGNAAVIDSMKIEWLSGTTSIFTNLQVNRYITVSEDGNITFVKDQSISPDFFELEQNYPNPFNPKTVINYELQVTSYLVSLKVFDVLGNELSTLVNEKQSAGRYTVTFDGSNFPSGVYFYKLQAGEFVETKRMVLLK
ncbi:MAG: ASPIC/UnbV domain-containing protein, partial [Ignavibacteria bacterium]